MLKTALIVDDSRLARLTLKKLLEAHHIEVNEADGVIDAERWIVNHLLPDLVFMDVMMPDLDGFEGLARLRKNPETRDLPVIMYSGDISEEARKKARDNGATGYLPKPADSNRLAHLINALNERLGSQETDDATVESLAEEIPEPTKTTTAHAARETISFDPAHPVAAEISFNTATPAAPAISSAELKEIKRRIEALENYRPEPAVDLTLRRRIDDLENRQSSQERNNNAHLEDALERQRLDLVFAQRKLADMERQLKIALGGGGLGVVMALAALAIHFI